MTQLDTRDLNAGTATQQTLHMRGFGVQASRIRYTYHQEVVSGADTRLLTALGVPGYRLIQPIPVLVDSDEAGDYIISDALFGVYGVGGTRKAAQQDYEVSLVEYYEILANATPDDKPTASLLKLLRQYVDLSDAQC